MEIITMSKTSNIIQQKNAIRDFWFESRATAFCPHYWLLDYKLGRRAQRTLRSMGRKLGQPIIDQTYNTHYDVHNK
jgi:hypothetical protein